MFRISKFLLTSEINLELFRTAQNYRYSQTTKSYLVYSVINNRHILASMGKSKKNTIADIEVPKRRGRAAGAKTQNKKTLYKLVKQYKPTNMVLWGIIAEQYRVACGELEARPAAVIKKFFVTKMCNSMRKPTGSSSIDNMKAK